MGRALAKPIMFQHRGSVDGFRCALPILRAASKFRSHAPDAAQRFFSDALQSRGPRGSKCCGFLGPGSAQQRKIAAARPGHESGGRWYFTLRHGVRTTEQAVS
ncbi:hypothetical protein BwSH20_49410 [Bradyrhizobium ottawaense]|jgi:hypothetical protein|nr:hypothetical protein SG09_72130 [Bradyrhizobium ottawaense]GMO53126.1 hypothetical protein BwSF12_64590 [Bradyrhizobium ottawaense]GMO75868.1 hypothetical protein BwSF19_20390 [Bradyrhizobium ottawaense]GMO80764.1 hypothetical protein BwSG10_53270 [Bradyrhizobium ottawaense]GMO82990.1 hypothetical protein BwSG20_65820 [Bradyrhizobium ottawaense]